MSVRRLRGTGEVVRGPALQYRIDGNDHQEWGVDGAFAARGLGESTPVRGHVELVRIRGRGTYVRKSSKWAEFNDADQVWERPDPGPSAAPGPKVEGAGRAGAPPEAAP